MGKAVCQENKNHICSNEKIELGWSNSTVCVQYAVTGPTPTVIEDTSGSNLYHVCDLYNNVRSAKAKLKPM